MANHALSGVLAHHNHNADEEQREKALEAWATRLKTLAMSSNVAQLRRIA